MRRHVVVRSGAGLVTAATVVWLFPAVFLAPLGRFLVRSDQPVKSDCIFVFAGDFRGQRIIKAAELYRDGYAKRVFVSGAGQVLGTTEDQLAIHFARGSGFTDVPFEGMPHNANSTETEAESVLPKLKESGCLSVLAVTSDFHTRRVANVTGRKWRGLDTRVVAAPTDDYNPDHWWQDRQSRKTFLMEWTKTFANWIGL